MPSEPHNWLCLPWRTSFVPQPPVTRASWLEAPCGDPHLKEILRESGLQEQGAGACTPGALHQPGARTPVQVPSGLGCR